MEENYDMLMETLEHSVKKNGEILLTNKHLLNILKLVRNMQDEEDDDSNHFSQGDIY